MTAERLAELNALSEKITEECSFIRSSDLFTPIERAVANLLILWSNQDAIRAYHELHGEKK